MVSNSTIKLIQSLKLKKYRQKYNLFVVEGWKAIMTVLSQNEVEVERIYTTNFTGLQGSLQSPQIIEVSESELRRISHLQSPTTAIALVSLSVSMTQNINLGKRIIYLDDIQDPGNFGTIIRLADWYGFSSVVRSPGSADFYGPKVIQSTMGSFVNLNLATLSQTEMLNLSDLQLVVTALEGDNSLLPLRTDDPICLVIGNEGKGVSQSILDRATLIYTIEGACGRKAESLNAAIATGIMCEKIFKLTK